MAENGGMRIPLPLRPTKRAQPEQITQFSVHKTSESFEIRLVTVDGNESAFVKDLETADQARFLEHARHRW